MALTDRGRRQARALVPLLRTFKIDGLAASSLKRARQTGQILSATLGMKMTTDSRLNEISFGEWEGRTAEELIRRKDTAFRLLCRGRHRTPPGGETLASFRRRVAAFLKDLLKQHPQGTVALVSHGGTIKMMLCEILRIPFPSFWAFPMEPATLMVADLHRHLAKWVCVKLTGPLDRTAPRCRI